MGVLIGLQALPALLTQFPVMDTAVGLTLIVIIFGSLALAGLAAIFRQWTASTFAWFAVIYLVGLVFWPVLVPGPIPGHDASWIYYLCNIGTGFAAIAARRRWWLAAAYTVVTPTVLAWLRTLPEGGSASVTQAALDGLYCFFLGAVLLVVSVALRQASAAVDAAQENALDSYAGAVRHNATENERVQIDALVHDSVLTTMLSAARARTPESKALAARMARNAMGHLTAARSSFPAPPTDVPLGVVAGRLRLAVAEQPVTFDLHMRDLGSGSGALPDTVADALVSAATQAMVNSVNHAGGPETARTLAMVGIPGGVSVTVTDDGPGFDLASIPVERLGVRTSILDRMAKVGGTAEVVSQPGAGTRIELAWTAPAAHADEPVLQAQGWAE
jgi:signal transduction histidine kinase